VLGTDPISQLFVQAFCFASTKNMTMHFPHVISSRWPTVKSDRFAATIQRDSLEDCQLALLGLPDDTGIQLNHGRPGAAEGPTAFRNALANYGTTWDGQYSKLLDIKVFDAGDVEPVPGGNEAALFATHDRIEQTVTALHRMGLLPVCVGGGHDLTLPAVTALAKHIGSPVGGINVDAHLDVRTRVGSGMSYRRLIESRHLDPRHFAEVGIGRFVNDKADLDWLSKQGGTVIFADTIIDNGLHVDSPVKSTFNNSPASFLSIDLDSFDSSAAPGVSALNPCGLSVRHAAAVAEMAGAHPNVRHFDLMELSPRHDPSGRTARVAAMLFLYFVAGFANRPTGNLPQ
jgi:formiminoglutamase